MVEVKGQETADSLATLPTAKEVMEQIALKEAEKASAAARELSAAEAEKKALIEKFSKPSGVSDEERLARAAAIIKRAANNGLTEVEVVRFPNEICLWTRSPRFSMCLIRSPPIRMPFQVGSAQSALTEECGYIPILRRRCK